MGTRHLIAVIKDGNYKVAQYGQWDGDPDGQGADVCKFLADTEKFENLKYNLSKVRFLDAEGKDKDFVEAYDKNAPAWSNEPDKRTPEQKRWFANYCSRNLGAEVLTNIAKSDDEEIILKDSRDFLHDSLFCEYAYIINLDTNNLEFYKSSQKVSEMPFAEASVKLMRQAIKKAESATV